MTLAVQGRRPRMIGRSELTQFALPLAFSLLATLLLFTITPLSGGLGFVIVAYVVFLVAFFLYTRQAIGAKAGADRVVTVAISSAAFLVIGALLSIVIFVVGKGIAHLNTNFVTKTLEGLGPDQPQSAGGALHALVGTLIQVGAATAVAVPFGVMTAVYLHEIGGRLVPVVRVIVDAMSGLPSIVAGLFIYSVWVVGAKAGFSGLAASLALGMLMLPTVARTTEEMLKLVDPSLREASLALGSPQWRVVWQVVLPTARTGIVTAVILGIARIAGETAPLLMTSFGNDRVSVKGFFNEPQSSLPLYIFQQFSLDRKNLAWAGALLLVLIVLVLFLLARFIGRDRATR